ncbi:hypothetical protein HAX54_049386 [Datura stramonium]|uniref:Uncharacterized protein n=1 Tax=Datura stramonium TaxID=4076 RepID=A0ABS8SWH8_DATST|nr:hypothetical protein [Datura stramonium]
MADVAVAKSWRDELASLVEDSGIRFAGDAIGISTPTFSAPAFEEKRSVFESPATEEVTEEPESFRDQIEKTKGPLAEASKRLSVLNEFLPEDRDPVHVAGDLLRLHPRLLRIECKK